MAKNEQKVVLKQTELDLGLVEAVPTEKEKGRKAQNRQPATPLMKKVASRAPNMKNMKKVFSDDEMSEILRNEVLELPKNEAEEKARKKELYRKIKRRVKELEKGNQSRLFVFPSLTSGEDWYKMIEFSALYYVYRLAERMGRGARVYKDTDKFSKAIYTASLQNIEKFVEQFKRFEGTEPEITEDGVYIFTLKRPATDDEVGALRRTEETRRERMHNILKPKAMDPAVYQAILMVVRQVSPRAKKLDGMNYRTIGEDMLRGTRELLRVYFNFADGNLTRKETGEQLINIVDSLLAGVAILAETRVWTYDISSVIGENINVIKRIVVRDFVEKTKNG